MAQATGSLELNMEFPELTELREQFKTLPKNIAAKHLGAALRKAMAPGQAALRKNTPKGPTGNLRKSIKTKIKVYAKNGNAVGLVGYEIGGGSKGYHQGFLEFGTKERKTKGPVASSFKQRGQFTIARPRKLGKPPKNLFGAAGDRYAARYRSRLKVQTNPKYPKAFFKRAADGKVVKLGKMPVGGRTGVPPVKTAFNQAQPAMRSLLQQELATRLEKALNEVKGRVARGLIT
jgi:HK97 gp10 family phage protein